MPKTWADMSEAEQVARFGEPVPAKFAPLLPVDPLPLTAAGRAHGERIARNIDRRARLVRSLFRPLPDEPEATTPDPD